jgi:hypothetical protein
VSFTLIVFGGIVLMVVALILIGRGSSGAPLEQVGLRSAREILATREALEVEDLEQMLAAHNARRAARGEPAVSADQIELEWMRQEGALAKERAQVKRELGDQAPGGEPESSRWSDVFGD